MAPLAKLVGGQTPQDGPADPVLDVVELIDGRLEGREGPQRGHGPVPGEDGGPERAGCELGQRRLPGPGRPRDEHQRRDVGPHATILSLTRPRRRESVAAVIATSYEADATASSAGASSPRRGGMMSSISP